MVGKEWALEICPCLNLLRARTGMRGGKKENRTDTSGWLQHAYRHFEAIFFKKT
jgi:hypothetical protein